MLSLFILFYKHHVRKSVCRLILCMLDIFDPFNVFYHQKPQNTLYVVFVLCRRLAYGWHQHSRKWTQRDDYAEMVHSTNQQHRLVQSAEVCISCCLIWRGLSFKALHFQKCLVCKLLIPGQVTQFSEFKYFIYSFTISGSTLNCVTQFSVFELLIQNIDGDSDDQWFMKMKSIRSWNLKSWKKQLLKNYYLIIKIIAD